MSAKSEYLALTLNIHKGFSASNLRYTLEALRVALRDSGCNLKRAVTISESKAGQTPINSNIWQTLFGLISPTDATPQRLWGIMAMQSSVQLQSAACITKT